MRKARLRFMESLHAFFAWLVHLQQHKIPQMLVFTCGMINCALALIFLRFPERIDSSPALRYLATSLDTDWWVVIFGALGVMQWVLALARYTVAAFPCFLGSVAMFVFAALTGANFVLGPAAGLVTVMSVGIGAINLIASAGAAAPWQKRESEEFLARHGD